MMVPPGAEHGWIAAKILVAIANHVESRDLGKVYSETGFVLARDPDTVRAPDVAFVRSERAVATSRAYFEGAPDLAVEVLSPDDRPGYVREKVAEWLKADARAVWVIDPRDRTVTVHERRRKAKRLGEADTLRGGSVLPGFETPVAAIFA